MPALEEAEGTLEGLRSLQTEIVDSVLSRVRGCALDPTEPIFHALIQSTKDAYKRIDKKELGMKNGVRGSKSNYYSLRFEHLPPPLPIGTLRG